MMMDKPTIDKIKFECLKFEYIARRIASMSISDLSVEDRMIECCLAQLAHSGVLYEGDIKHYARHIVDNYHDDTDGDHYECYRRLVEIGNRYVAYLDNQQYNELCGIKMALNLKRYDELLELV